MFTNKKQKKDALFPRVCIFSIIHGCKWTQIKCLCSKLELKERIFLYLLFKTAIDQKSDNSSIKSENSELYLYQNSDNYSCIIKKKTQNTTLSKHIQNITMSKHIQIPHCRNISKIPHCRNISNIPHCRNIFKIQCITSLKGAKNDIPITQTHDRSHIKWIKFLFTKKMYVNCNDY